MPVTSFESLPSDARVWVFAADAALSSDGEHVLLREVDDFLSQWNAHGHPLACGRVWRDGRFLAIGVDQSSVGASGCSIDGLFRVLQRITPVIGASLLPGPRVFFRDDTGAIQSVKRADFSKLAASGGVTAGTHVFDTAVTTAEDWRQRFERRADESWHGALLR